jgi:hypothetical protein
VSTIREVIPDVGPSSMWNAGSLLRRRMVQIGA